MMVIKEIYPEILKDLHVLNPSGYRKEAFGVLPVCVYVCVYIYIDAFYHLLSNG
jgi:hypothetical protein